MSKIKRKIMISDLQLPNIFNLHHMLIITLNGQRKYHIPSPITINDIVEILIKEGKQFIMKVKMVLIEPVLKFMFCNQRKLCRTW